MRVVGGSGHQLQLAPTPERPLDPADAAGITSVVWCIGHRADHRWVQVGVFDGLGAVRHDRGVTGVPGL